MKKLIPIFVIFAVVLILYYPVLTTYFSQDDFFMFKVSKSDGTLGGFLKLFAIHPFSERGIAFYRPIFREALHNIYFSIFGLNHLPFRILMFLIHFINISLVFYLVNKIFKDKAISFFTAFFFGITAANVALLYYLAGGIEAGGATMFALLTLILYRKYLISNKLKVLLFSFLTFLLALFSHEIVAMISGVLLIMLITSPVKKALSKAVSLLPFFLATMVLLYVDMVEIGLSPGEEQYQLIFNIKSILNSLAWYSGWALGLPETLIDFVQPGLKLNPVLMRYWGNYYIIIFPAFMLALTGLIIALICLLLKSKKVFFNKQFLFFLFWFPIGITPVIFLPTHKSTHYLVFVLPAFWTILGFIILNFYRLMSKIHVKFAAGLLSITIISLATLSITSIKLEDTTYWAASRGRLAEKLLSDVKSRYPTLPKGSIIYFTNDSSYPFLTKEWGGTSKQASLILNGSDALQLLYKDQTIKVYYEDLGGPSNNLKDKVYTLKAKLN